MVQIRDKDALFMINERDYELVQASFTKHPTKVNIPHLLEGKSPAQLRCQKYRLYNVAFYEEVLIHYLAESRVA